MAKVNNNKHRYKNKSIELVMVSNLKTLLIYCKVIPRTYKKIQTNPVEGTLLYRLFLSDLSMTSIHFGQ